MPELPDILLVDDSPTHLAVLEDLLTEHGFRTETANNGIEAIEKIHATPPRLVLSDVMMPKLNGYHLCRLLKNDPSTTTLPIILLTNLKERHDRFWGEHAGADLFLPKEIAADQLITAVKKMISPASRTISASEVKSSTEDVQDRLNQILDRLLYESTISNQLLELTGLAHDPSRLATEFFELLSMLCRFDAALLLLPTGRETFSLFIRRPANGSEAQRYYQVVRTSLPAVPEFQQLFQTIELAQTEGAPENLQLAHYASFRVSEKLAGSFAFFRRGRLSERALQALNVVTERFEVIIRYLVTFNEIEEMKSDFVSMLVHDLRSPLTSIKGFNEVLSSEMLGSINAEQHQACDAIQENSDRMLVLIEDLLELSKLESGKSKMHPGPVDLHHLAETACKMLQVQLDAKQQTVTFDFQLESGHVIADGKQIGRVFSNLLANAIKFTPEGGKIRIETLAEEERYLRVKVTDTGTGISKEQQTQLFERYLQLSASGIFKRGTGLGLAICKEIIQQHGGTIEVASPVNVDGGSCFSFTLPLLN